MESRLTSRDTLPAADAAGGSGNKPCVAVPTQQDESAAVRLLKACKNGDLEGVREAHAAGASLRVCDSAGATGLWLACDSGEDCLELVEWILYHGTGYATLDAADNVGRTPLMMAARRGNRAVVELLLKNKANVLRRDNQHKDAERYARESNHQRVAKVIKGGFSRRFLFCLLPICYASFL